MCYYPPVLDGQISRRWCLPQDHRTHVAIGGKAKWWPDNVSERKGVSPRWDIITGFRLHS